jgi:hypothetical protein
MVMANGDTTTTTVTEDTKSFSILTTPDAHSTTTTVEKGTTTVCHPNCTMVVTQGGVDGSKSKGKNLVIMDDTSVWDRIQVMQFSSLAGMSGADRGGLKLKLRNTRTQLTHLPSPPLPLHPSPPSFSFCSPIALLGSPSRSPLPTRH